MPKRNEILVLIIAVSAICCIAFAVIGIGVALIPSKEESKQVAVALPAISDKDRINTAVAIANEETKSSQLNSTETITPTSTATSTLPPTYTATIEASATSSPTPEISIPDNPEMSCIPRGTIPEKGIATSVVDGDTIHDNIDGQDYPVRYIGMDTPENTIEKEFYGQEASDYNKQLVEGKEAILVKDVSETDEYDRLLRYVIVGEIFVNYDLVKNSYANAKSYPPDTACNPTFQEVENQAIIAHVGVWANQTTPTQTVAVSTVGSCPQGCTEQKPGCDIKGNINAEGVKIYHTPSSSSYEKTKIDPTNGERWFCTAEEAVANG